MLPSLASKRVVPRLGSAPAEEASPVSAEEAVEREDAVGTVRPVAGTLKLSQHAPPRVPHRVKFLSREGVHLWCRLVPFNQMR